MTDGSVNVDDDAGFGLVEIIIAMTIFALLAMAIAPVLLGGVQASVKMASMATATQLVNDGLEQARFGLPKGTACPSPSAPATVLSATDSRGVAFERRTTVRPDTACDTKRRALVSVEVVATQDSALYRAGQVVAEARTVVFLG